MTVAAADEKAKQLAKQLGEMFFLFSQRKQANRIGCSWQTWKSAPFFKEAARKQVQLSKNSKRATASAQAMSLTDALQAKIPVGEKDQVFKQLENNDELRRLTNEQLKENEPSPLDDDEPGFRPRRVNIRKRV